MSTPPPLVSDVPTAAAHTAYTDFAGLGRLRASAHHDPKGSARAVAQQFEGLFVQMVLKTMREASFGDTLFDSDQSRMYRDMFDGQLSTMLAGNGGIGLTDAILRQLGGEVRPTSPPAGTLPRPAAPPPVARAAPPAPGLLEQPLHFVRAVWDQARTAAAQLGTEAKLLVAQAALETGWGRHVPQRPDGGSSNNFFGVKAGAKWSGDRVAVPTLEFRDGVVRRENASFRAYDSVADGFNDYVRLLKSNPRYRAALELADDPRHFAQALQRAGYATDPAYGQKILGILDGDVLGAAIGALKP
ncbi:MAG: glucosaminidase domain-containing protein [Porticoccaceae bacterium]